MWLVTRRRFRIDTTARPGTSSSNLGEIEAKYGARQHTSRENNQRPAPVPCKRAQIFVAADSFMLPVYSKARIAVDYRSAPVELILESSATYRHWNNV